ncbi:hypothetical protein HYT56_00410 [Candidatus Woesearchaeota archaeon]|nr:hypothetical protein [Candidatus Woesearchaeota archaeon]
MITYKIEFLKSGYWNDNSRGSNYNPEDIYEFDVDAETIEMAVLKAIPIMFNADKRSMSCITDARIIDPNNPDSPYEILKKGKLLVDKEGKTLEEKV